MIDVGLRAHCCDPGPPRLWRCFSIWCRMRLAVSLDRHYPGGCAGGSLDGVFGEIAACVSGRSLLGDGREEPPLIGVCETGRSQVRDIRTLLALIGVCKTGGSVVGDARVWLALIEVCETGRSFCCGGRLAIA